MFDTNDFNSNDEVTLINCDREPIQFAEAIQPHGLLFLLEADSLEIVRASENVGEILGRPLEFFLGRSLPEVFSSDLNEQFAEWLRAKQPGFLNSQSVSLETATGRLWFDLHAHRVNGQICLELEGPRENPRESSYTESLQEFFDWIRSQAQSPTPISIEGLCQSLVKEIRRYTGFDRVMVYQFLDDLSGKVIAEEKEPHFEPFLGLHYPSTDIPAQARRMYLLNWLRLIADVDYTPIRILPGAENPLNMTYSVLRSVSPIHIEYLKNMGVQASMSISLLKGDTLWGLIACHHYSPKWVPYLVRSACELLGSFTSSQITSKELQWNAVKKASLQEAATKIIRSISPETEFSKALISQAEPLCELFEANGFALASQDGFLTHGVVPSTDQLRDLLALLENKEDQEVFSTAELSEFATSLSGTNCPSSGMLAITLTKKPQRVLWFFRPEQVLEVRWAGNPEKVVKEVAVKEDVKIARLTPRGSFEEWKQTVRGKSKPWDSFMMDVAQEVRTSLFAFVIRQSEELAELNEKLVVANQELDSFAYAASHGLKEPLRGIHHHASMIESEALPNNDTEGAINSVRSILRLTERMEELIESLMHYSQMARTTFTAQEIDLNELLDEALEMVSARRTERGGKVSVPRPLPVIYCDRFRIREVFVNLLSNALKYSESDPPEIEVGWREGFDEEGEREQIFYVSDNGIGISERYLPRIFKMFKRLHSQTAYGGGNGVGLAIVKKIIERHRGRIWVESELGKGSTFCFTIQLEPAENPN
ncbi:Multi-sensor signal transduction histidine kinase [Planctomycetales bacterium 10988]|nr:Multi-sensor signal transduction histidine kinase [Planctomycetales bacterium 10988]